MTTNGATLALVADDLAAAGLRRVNISLDSLRRDRFAALTRRDMLDRVLEGIDAALAAGLTPVKVNAVVVRGVNDDEVVELARFGRDRGVVVRFIEYMPLDADGGWDRDQVVPGAEIVGRRRRALAASMPRRRAMSPPAAGATSTVPARSASSRRSPTPSARPATGSASPPTAPSAPCLFAVEETDLRGPLRAGASRRRPRRPARDHRRRRSGPATASARSSSSGPAGRCPRSADDPSAEGSCTDPST